MSGTALLASDFDATLSWTPLQPEKQGTRANVEHGCGHQLLGSATGPGVIVTCIAGGVFGAAAGSQYGGYAYDNYVEPGWNDYQEDKVGWFRLLQTGRP